jgi:sugar diacid utilization regulator
VIRLGHEATHLQKQRREIENANKVLQYELDRLTSLHSVEQKAAALGFQHTDPRAVVMVRGDNRQPTTANRKGMR